MFFSDNADSIVEKIAFIDIFYNQIIVIHPVANMLFSFVLYKSCSILSLQTKMLILFLKIFQPPRCLH
jgi:hypothetical protein